MRLMLALAFCLGAWPLAAQTRQDSLRVQSAVADARFVVEATVVRAQYQPVRIDSVPVEARVLTVAVVRRWKGDAPDTLQVLLRRGGHPQYLVPDAVGSRLLLYLMDLKPELLVVGAQSGSLEETFGDLDLIGAK